MAKTNDSNKQKIKLSPKLADLVRWSKIDEVNQMLDAGTSPAQVCKWINKNGFKISAPLVYDYEKIRQQAVLNGVTIEKLLGISMVSRDASVKPGGGYETKKNKLRNEIDALDKIIDMGYSSLDKYEDKPLPISILMQAIKLKNELTDGYFMGLTEYGITQLQELEKQKYEVIFDLMMNYIPEELREQVKDEIAVTEEDFYKHSNYYSEYLRASGLPEEEVQKKLLEWEKEQEDEGETVITA
jgi:hypothetical protein